MTEELELPWGTDPLIGGEPEEQRARRQQAEEAIAAHLSLGMDRRAWFGFEEIAHELAKPSLGKLPEPDQIAYQRKRLLDAFRNGAFDREGAPTVLNRRSWMRPFSRELLLGLEREHQPAIDSGVYQADYVAQFYLSRTVTADYLAANGHPWPVEWGRSPLIDAGSDVALHSPAATGGSADPVEGPVMASNAEEPVAGHRRGPVPGQVDRYGESDRALFPELERLMREERLSRTAAAKKLGEAGRIEGVGSAESRAMRLATRHGREAKNKPTPTR